MERLELAKKSNWIWTSELYDKEKPCIIYFRKEFTLEKDVEHAIFKVSADSRYRLFVNGISIAQGPCKGDDKVWYYDEVNLKAVLRKGVNTFAAIVLRYPEGNGKGNRSIWRTPMPGFYLKGSITFEDRKEISLGADESWKSFYADKISLGKSEAFERIFVFETAKGDSRTYKWKEQGFDDSSWPEAKAYLEFGIKKAVSPGGITKRPIPFMYEKPRNFQNVVCVRNGGTAKADWQKLISGQQTLTIVPNTKAVVEISAGEEETAFIETAFIGGKETRLSILASEAYVYEQNADIYNPMPKKGDRTDYIKGHLEGTVDNYEVGGFGTKEFPEEYEPFWFRTFRFMQIVVETKEEPLTITKLSYRETGYPLEVKTKVETSDKALKEIWDISERTLRRCMHETYEDCPFYEQLQYAMDARSEILFTYNVSADDRLARKCIDDFFRSQRYDGMINACYPSTGVNVIPGFSIYYILMIYDHMMYFGDKKLVEKYMTSVVRILQFFNEHLEGNGLTERTSEGGMGGSYWSFVDWVDTWEIGVPNAIKEGAVTMDSLLYLMGLQAAVKLANYIDLPDLAASFSKKAERIKQAVLHNCVGRNGLIQDGPGFEEYSQHAQVFAVLTEVVTGEQAKKIMKIALTDREIAKCSVAMAYYLFRAVEKVGLYDKTNELWDLWRQMLKNNLTTCVENNVDERSDCHAWGALALYELPAVILGVRPAEPGYASIKVSPNLGYLQWAKGEVITPRGLIKVEWIKEKMGNINIKLEVPEDVKYSLS